MQVKRTPRHSEIITGQSLRAWERPVRHTCPLAMPPLVCPGKRAEERSRKVMHQSFYLAVLLITYLLMSVSMCGTCPMPTSKYSYSTALVTDCALWKWALLLDAAEDWLPSWSLLLSGWTCIPGSRCPAWFLLSYWNNTPKVNSFLHRVF